MSPDRRDYDWERVKGLVLAGGVGTGLRPFTFTGAKQLLPVANKPVLFYGLEQLVAAGVHEIGIIVGNTAAEVEAAVGDGGHFGAQITYLRQPEPLGLAHAVAVGRAWLASSPFVMVLGDNFVRGGITGLVDRFRAARPAAQVHLVRVPNPEDLGVAIVDAGGQLLRVVEKPRERVSDLGIIGVYCFTPEIHGVIEHQQPSARGEHEITDAIQGLLDLGQRVDALPVDDYWGDTGKMAGMLAANRAALETMIPRIDGLTDGASQVSGRVVVETGARVCASIVEGPVIIGRDTIVERSYVGPFTSIYHGCRILDAEIAGSIVLERTTISGLPSRIEASLIGRDVQLRGVSSRPHTYRLVLGDRSEASLP